MPTLEQNAIISAWALIPFVVACFVLGGFMYSHRKGSLTRSAGLDMMLWFGAAAVFYGGSLGLMQLQLPGTPRDVSTKEEK